MLRSNLMQFRVNYVRYKNQCYSWKYTAEGYVFHEIALKSI